MMKIIPVSAFKDNYIWIGVNEALLEAFVVDPGDATPVLAYLNAHHLNLVGIFLTHKHWDHTDGVGELLAAYPNVPVYAHALENIAVVTQTVAHGDVISLDGWDINFRVIHIPGHTLGHVAYYGHSVLFSGDTLFGAGCGRLFEGTAEQMLGSLNQLAALPGDTLVYCGHEYTLANLQFALQVEPANTEIKNRIQCAEKMRSNNQPTLPSTLALEIKTNPFLRCMKESVLSAVEKHLGHPLVSQVEVFHELREWKNTRA